MAVAQIDDRLSTEEASPLTAEEQKFADAALAGLTEEQRAKLTPIDIITVVRGYQTYEPRLEETNKAMKLISDWRDKAGFDKFLTAELPMLSEFHKAWPESIYGVDKYGHVTVGFRFEEVVIAGLDKIIESEKAGDEPSESALLLRLQGQKIAAMMKYKILTAAAAGTQRYKHNIIIDLSGLGMSLLASHKRHVIKMVMDVSANYFPECVWKIYVINAPFVFRAMWAVVKPWIHPITVAKVNVLGSPKDAVKKMAEFGLPESSVPVWAGGSCAGQPIIDVLQKYISEGTH